MVSLPIELSTLNNFKELGKCDSCFQKEKNKTGGSAFQITSKVGESVEQFYGESTQSTV